jgi:hypothetical protein
MSNDELCEYWVEMAKIGISTRPVPNARTKSCEHLVRIVVLLIRNALFSPVFA